MLLAVIIMTATTARAEDEPTNKPPYFIDQDKIKLAVYENTPRDKGGTIKAKDDEGDRYTFEITGGTAKDLFVISIQTGVVAMKDGVEPFDYEEWKEAGTDYTIVVELCDARAYTFNKESCSQAKFTVSVADVNEPPYFTNKTDVISIVEGANISTDKVTYADPDKYTDKFLNNELFIIGDDSELFEITSDGYIKPKAGAVIDKSEYKLKVRVRDANKDADGNFEYPLLYEDKTFIIRYYTTGVDYLDWDDIAKKLVKKNTATDDNDANDKVYILDGTETTLGTAGTSSALTEAWYIAQGNVSFDHQLTNATYCNIHLILADGCTMTVGTEENPIISKAINIDGGNLTIYGQEKGTGSLTAVSFSSCGIYGSNSPNLDTFLTINGGQVTAKGTSGIRVLIYKNSDEARTGGVIINGGQVTANGNRSGIVALDNNSHACPTVTINGGEVYATNSDFGAEEKSAIYGSDVIITGGHVKAKNSDDNGYAIASLYYITITGGQVEAIRTTCCYGYNPGYSGYSGENDITLGWTDIDDYIQASKYILGVHNFVKIPAGKGFVIDGTTTVFGSAIANYTFSNDDLTAIAGKKLTPALPIATGGVDYLAFTSGIGNWKSLGDDVQVYAVTGYDLAKGKVYMKPVEGNVIPKGVPVVIGNKTEDTALPADIFLIGSDAQTTTLEGLLKNFVNCDGSKTLQDYLDAVFGEGVSASEYVPYVLSGGTFKSVNVKATDVIKQDVCLLFIPKWDVLRGNSAGTTSTATTRSIGIGSDDGTATGIEVVENIQFSMFNVQSDSWYDLQGRRLSGKPARKGLYLQNGKKVVMK